MGIMGPPRFYTFEFEGVLWRGQEGISREGAFFGDPVTV